MSIIVNMKKLLALPILIVIFGVGGVIYLVSNCNKINKTEPDFPIYPGSVLREVVVNEASVYKRKTLIYVVEETPEIIMEFYRNQGARCGFGGLQTACVGAASPDYVEYTVYIDYDHTGESGLSHLVIELRWRACSLDIY
jgi:hypothetical protein